MTKIRFIGDVHGKMDQYVAITAGCERSIQVGDFGAGFVPLPELPIVHSFIRGNHDDPGVCNQSWNWIEDGRWNPTARMFFVGGAWSIDQASRVEGVSWWRDEELSMAELENVIDAYGMYQPEVMVTHDCPESVVEHLSSVIKISHGSRTRQALQAMLEIHRPKLWIFGHWHQSLDITIDGTRFICLNELEYKDLDI